MQADADLQTALEAMSDHQLRRIPVIDNNNRIVGNIAQADVATRVEQPEKVAVVVEGNLTIIKERAMTYDPNYVIPMSALEAFYDEPGERGWILEGYKHGLSTTSAIVTETAPGGGPPLHVHHSEEIHVLPECQMAYVMGDTEFDAFGPCVIRIPAELPHTFLNRGSSPVRLVCFFPANNFWTNYEELGPNPLVGGQASETSASG